MSNCISLMAMPAAPTHSALPFLASADSSMTLESFSILTCSTASSTLDCFCRASLIAPWMVSTHWHIFFSAFVGPRTATPIGAIVSLLTQDTRSSLCEAVQHASVTAAPLGSGASPLAPPVPVSPFTRLTAARKFCRHSHVALEGHDTVNLPPAASLGASSSTPVSARTSLSQSSLPVEPPALRSIDSSTTTRSSLTRASPRISVNSSVILSSSLSTRLFSPLHPPSRPRFLKQAARPNRTTCPDRLDRGARPSPRPLESFRQRSTSLDFHLSMHTLT